MLAASLLLVIPFLTATRAEVQRDPNAYLPYVPNLIGNTIIAILYTLICIFSFLHIFHNGPKTDKWALVLPIGLGTEAIGFWCRLILRRCQTNHPIFTIMFFAVVLSPATYLAFNYILFGRFLAALHGHKPDQETGKSRYSFIPPKKIKVFFVSSDIITFLIQIGGGSMQLSTEPATISSGNNIFLIGTLCQLLSYIFFFVSTIYAHCRLGSQNRSRFSPLNLREPCVHFAIVLYLSSIGIMIRSSYRVAEFFVGYTGYLTHNENYVFALDAAPLLVATGVWVVFWPGQTLRQISNQAPAVGLEHSLSEIMVPEIDSKEDSYY